jgi:hypothetical protein
MTDERRDAIQAVVDRVRGYQVTAPEPMIDSELRRGLAEAGLDLPEEDIVALVEAIESDRGPVDVGSILRGP